MNRKTALSIAMSALFVSGLAVAQTTGPLFHHKFDGSTDVSGKYTGTAYAGAKVEKIGDEGIVNLGQGNGYFDFGSKLGEIISGLSGNYTISAILFIPDETPLGANGNFVLNFGNSSSTGYAFFGANSSRYSITPTNWGSEQTVNANTAFPKGEWVNLVIKQDGNKASIYFNGQLKSTQEIKMKPSELGKTSQNWLGKSPYDGDVYLKGAKYSDFRIYDSALSDDDIAAIAQDKFLHEQNALIYKEAVINVVGSYDFDFSDIRSNITLPIALGQGVTGVWASSDPSLVATDGSVNRPAVGNPDGSLTLTLTATKGNYTQDFTYPATVKANINDKDATAFDLDNLTIKGGLNNLRSALKLPATTSEGSYITWTSSDPEYLSNEGRVMKLAPKGTGKKEITLTATARRNNETATKDFKVSVAEEEDYSSYLFVYFPSNDNENLYYALGTDGFTYTPLNHGQMIMDSKDVALKGGIRDPHIYRGPDGKTFYMVATDMKCSEGWSSNRGMVLYKSTDLVNWEHHTVHFPDRFPEWKNVTRVWAPEVIWDENYENADGSKGRMLVYYSLLTNDGKCTYDKVYYSYANDDFSDLMTDPEYFYDRGSATIDCDIIMDDRDGLYHMVFKNEGQGGICQVTATRLTPEPGKPAGSQWSKPSGTLQQTNEAVEGAGMFRLINSDTWILMYDCYMNGHYQFCSSEDLENFTLRAQTNTSGAFTPRHGTVIPITPEEEARLLKAYPIDVPAPKVTGSFNPTVRAENFKITGNKVFIPVRYGVDLTSFDPMLSTSLMATATPEGPQDFTKGAITYTVNNGSTTSKYDVNVEYQVNPVLPGFKADPEVMFSHKTGRFYIYPTSDGYPGWGGYEFKAFSSTDLVNWQEENVILDLASDQVTWATGNAWAPCIEEVYRNGKYSYYFYFSGHNPSVNYKTLGCAVSDSPTGPFTDLGKPLVEKNIASGQLIDSDIFTDSKNNTYFYWGNGSLVASKMNKDMVSYSDPKVITPSGGNLDTHAFREGVYVFERNGKYYFLWSVDDTGAKNYHVAYGTSDSPMGPIKVAANPVILKQDASNQIYGTGHNSIIKVPGKDEWYIVYHRINKNYVNSDPGIHREVCIDRMEFNEDGTIKPITPSHRGIDPVEVGEYMNEYITAVEEIASEAELSVIKTLYFNIDGTMIGNKLPENHGFYICTEYMDDGSVRSTKLMK